MPLHEGGMEVLIEWERPKDMGTRRPLSAGISMRSRARGPWTSAVEAPQNHELRLWSYATTGIYARCLEMGKDQEISPLFQPTQKPSWKGARAEGASEKREKEH